MERLSPMVQGLGPKTRASRVAMRFALVFALSTVVHLAVFLVDGGPWTGSVSWRKPIVFSLSFTAMLWAFGWLIDRIPRRRPGLAGSLAWVFGVSSVTEVGLISLQTWRGRPSHFNVFSSDDAFVFSLMGVAVAIISITLLILFMWTVFGGDREASTRWATLGGMALILAGLGLGQWIITLGTAYAENFGAVPEAVVTGEAGLVKFPHAVAFHGIQVFAVLLAVMKQTGWTQRRRGIMMRVAVLAYGGVLVFATAQTYVGLAPTDLRWWSGLLLGAATVTQLLVFGSALGSALGTDRARSLATVRV